MPHSKHSSNKTQVNCLLQKAPEKILANTISFLGARNKGRKLPTHAGYGIYGGLDSPLNTAEQVPGAQTNNRGEVFAILRLLQIVFEDQTLHIFSDSEYAIETICTRAADNAAC